MRTTATNKKLRLLLTGIKNRTLIPRPEFQRRLVWSNKHKISFLQTVLMEYPFPEIYIAAGEVNSETGEGTEMLVDGQQRITTLYQYFTGSEDLKLPRDVLPYAKLDEEKKRTFLEYEVVVRDLGIMSIDQIKQVFLRINSTKYAVNAMETDNARFDGEFKEFGEELASHRLFNSHGVFSANEFRRMQDLRFVLVFLVTAMSTYFNRDDELEEYLQKYNDEFDNKDDVRKQVNMVLEFVENLNFDTKSRVWKKADLFTLLVETHRLMINEKIDLNIKKTKVRLEEFYDQIDHFDQIKEPPPHVVAYHRAAIAATNDRGNRIRRGSVIKTVILGATWKEPLV